MESLAQGAISCLGKIVLPSVERPVWVPKNPEIAIPVKVDEAITDEQWEKSRFPHFGIPSKVETHVNVDVWDKYTSEMNLDPSCKRGSYLMGKVLDQLRHGVDSEVGPPGSDPTRTRNHFPDPEVDLAMMVDSLASEVKSGHMAGPLPIGTIPNAKVNGLMSVRKSDGGSRPVGNLSAPKGRSFNDGICKDYLQEWQVHQTTAAEFAGRLARAGRGAFIACSDMVSAYKCLPVTMKQRRLQCFHLLGKEFMDLRLIFGDKAACMNYDRFHHCILAFLVLPHAPLPHTWFGRTIDDIPSVVPKGALEMQQAFIEEYELKLTSLGIAFAAEDPNRRKAFKSGTSGEVLGVWFDTEQMTWRLSDKKIRRLLESLSLAVEGSLMSLEEVEVLLGRLINFTQLVPPLMLFVGESLQFLRDLLALHNAQDRKKRSRKFGGARVPAPFAHDMASVASIVQASRSAPLPVLGEAALMFCDAVKVFTDASGHIIDNPSLGVYSPEDSMHPPLVASLAFPRFFLLAKDDQGKKMFCKTTLLESLGFLAALCLDPVRFVGRKVLFSVDSIAAVLALPAGYSTGDNLATTVVRAARVVAAGLGSTISAEWEARRSSRGGRVADDLSHNLMEDLSEGEIAAYLSQGLLRFPQPIFVWMSSPRPDVGLGARCLRWIKEEKKEIEVFKSLKV